MQRLSHTLRWIRIHLRSRTTSTMSAVCLGAESDHTRSWIGSAEEAWHLSIWRSARAKTASCER